MRQLKGFMKKGQEEFVCHLKKSLYELKHAQSPCCRFKKLKDYLLTLGFKQSLADPCVFLQWKDDKLTIVACLVDDLIQIADLLADIAKLKCSLSDVSMTDLGGRPSVWGSRCSTMTDSSVYTNASA